MSPLARTIWDPSSFIMSLDVLDQSCLHSVRHVMCFLNMLISSDVSVYKFIRSNTISHSPRFATFSNMSANLENKLRLFWDTHSSSLWTIVSDSTARQWEPFLWDTTSFLPSVNLIDGYHSPFLWFQCNSCFVANNPHSYTDNVTHIHHDDSTTLMIEKNPTHNDTASAAVQIDVLWK